MENSIPKTIINLENLSTDDALQIVRNPEKFGVLSKEALKSILRILKDEDRNYSVDKHGGFNFSQHVGCTAEILLIENRLKEL